MFNWLFNALPAKESLAKVTDNYLRGITMPVIDAIKAQWNKFPMLYSWAAGITLFFAWLIKRRFNNNAEARNLSEINYTLRSQRDRLARIETNNGSSLNQIYDRLGDLVKNLIAFNTVALNQTTSLQNLQHGAQNHHSTMLEQFRGLKESFAAMSPIVFGTQATVCRIEKAVGEAATTVGTRPK